MELETYLKKYADSKEGRRFPGVSVNFDLKQAFGDDDFKQLYADIIEDKIRRWEAALAPGISYSRDGISFEVNVVTAWDPDHINAYQQALYSILPTDFVPICYDTHGDSP